MNVLITGGNGFLGSALASKFYNLNFKVSILVRPNSNLSRLQDNISNYKIFHLSDEIDFKHILLESKPDIIIHTACSYGRKNEELLTIFDANYRLGIIIINEILKSEKEIIFLNIGTILPKQSGLYAFSKNQFSELGKFISNREKKYTFKNIILQNMYGPNDDESKFTSYVINACLRNNEDVNLTRGNQLRDFIYIKDVIDAIVIICNNISAIDSIDIEIGSGLLVSIKDFVLKLHKLSNSNVKLNFGAIQDNINQFEIPAANIKILNNLNWKPSYNLDDGLVETIKMEIK